MKIDEHELRSIKLFGEPFTEVHLWLDEFCIYTMNHRGYRHNMRGLKFIEDKWGELARRAAEQHIADDGEYYIQDGSRYFYK